MAFVVAHRAGNDLARLRAAEEAGVALVEADVRLWRGRLEVRHLKTLGPVPLLWDRWELANPFAPRLTLPELLDAADPSTALLLDLKGFDRRLAPAVRDALAGRPHVTVCARSWGLLEPFAAVDGVRTIHSVGSRRQLRALLRLPQVAMLDGISIHERLLDAATVAELRRRAHVLITWPVNRLDRARELLELGVDGLITDDVAGVAAATA